MKKTIYSLFLLLLISCGGAGENSSELVYKELERESNPPKLTSTQVGGELMFNYVSNIYSYDKYLIVNADDPKAFFHIYDIESGEKVATGGRKGRSATELPQYLWGVTVVGNQLYACTIANEVKVYNLDEIIAGGSDGYVKTIKHKGNSGTSKMFFPLKEDKRLLISGGSMIDEGEKERLLLKEGDSTLFNYNKTIPIIDDTEETNFVFWRTFTHNSLNNKGNMLASVTRYGAVLEIFNLDVKHNKIENRVTKAFHKPAFEYKKKTFEGGGIAISMGPTEKSLLGFANIATTDKYIYTLYTGVMYSKKDDTPKPNLVIFNWKGDNIAEFELDENLSTISVSKDGNMLYGVAKDEEGVIFLVSYNLKNLI